MLKAGVNSIDSASHLRRAWLNAKENYFTMNGTNYSAIRIPQAGKSFRAKQMVNEGRASIKEIEKLEKECLRLVRDFDKGLSTLTETLDLICAYDELITDNRISIRPLLEQLLTEQPGNNVPVTSAKKTGSK